MFGLGQKKFYEKALYSGWDVFFVRFCFDPIQRRKMQEKTYQTILVTVYWQFIVP